MINRLETTIKVMTRHLAGAVLAMGMLLVTTLAQASTLTSLDYVSLPGSKLQLQLTFDGTPPKTKGYTIEKPARIVIDLLGTSSKLKTKYHSLGTGNARSATVIQGKDRTRLTIALMRDEGYSITTKGNRLLITLGGSSIPGSDASATQEIDGASIKKINFHRSKEGGGDVVIKLSDSATPVNVERHGKTIVARFTDTALPTKLRRRLDVTDFGTVVQYVDARAKGTDTVVTITADGNWDYLAYQADDTLTINVKKRPKNTKNDKKQAFQYTGQKLSLNFQDIAVRSVLQLIADFTNLNLVVADSVQGHITLRLKNVPWDQALALILKTQGLAKRKVGNVLLVAPADEIAAREKAELSNRKQKALLVPLQTEFISINYAKAGDIAALLSKDTSFLSKRGKVSVDQRTNTLIVQDIPSRMSTIRHLITTLDVPVQQVLIEARIVIASSNVVNKLGVRWGGKGFDDRSGNRSFMGSGSITGLGNAITGQIPTNDSMVVDLGITDPGATHFSLGFYSQSTGLLGLELSALDSEGKAQVVATPKVLTADQQTALISSGQEIPYTSTADSGGTNVEFKDAKLSLSVTPHITPDDRVIMDIEVHDDSVGQILGNGEPAINTHTVKTSVLVNNGETVVLGGIFQHTENHTVIKTPFLGNLPWIGLLFRQKIEVNKKEELLIFITPKIVKQRS